MGDSLTAFLASRSRSLDDIPSTAHPKGHSYSFTAPPWKTCLTLKAMYLLGVTGNTDPGELVRLSEELMGEQADQADKAGVRVEEILYRTVMGTTYDQLVTDGVGGDAMEAVFGLLLRKYGAGHDIAVQLRELQPAGESSTQPNRAKRRAVGQRAGSKLSTDGGTTPARTRARTSTPASSRTSTSAKAKKTA